MDLRERIRTIRKKLGLTQMEFAEKLGKSWRTIQDWEAGKRNIPEPELRLISQIFGVSYEWLKTGQGEIFEKKPKGDKVIAKIYIGDGFDIPNRKIVIVANQDGELLVKRLMKKDGLILLTSDNPNYPPIIPQEARIIAVALKLLREISL